MRESLIRAVMVSRRRRNHKGQPLCDLCGKEHGAERHHIVTRFRTMGSDYAAALANSAALTALLCRTCHDIVDIPANRDALLLKLYDINGKGDVARGYKDMKHIFDEIGKEIWLPWELPKPHLSNES